MPDSTYHFSRATRADYTQLKNWLHTPAVSRWWGDPAEQAALLKNDLADTRMAIAMRMVWWHDKPFAFVQDYEVHVWPQPHLKHLPAGTRAMDTFIGLPEMLGKGHGPAYIKLRAHQLLAGGAPEVVIDPAIENLGAINAYRKAGFSAACETFADGRKVLLMRFSAEL